MALIYLSSSIIYLAFISFYQHLINSNQYIFRIQNSKVPKRCSRYQLILRILQINVTLPEDHFKRKYCNSFCTWNMFPQHKSKAITLQEVAQTLQYLKIKQLCSSIIALMQSNLCFMIELRTVPILGIKFRDVKAILRHLNVNTFRKTK